MVRIVVFVVDEVCSDQTLAVLAFAIGVLHVFFHELVGLFLGDHERGSIIFFFLDVVDIDLVSRRTTALLSRFILINDL